MGHTRFCCLEHTADVSVWPMEKLQGALYYLKNVIIVVFVIGRLIDLRQKVCSEIWDEHLQLLTLFIFSYSGHYYCFCYHDVLPSSGVYRYW